MRHIFRIPEEYRQGDYFYNDEDSRSLSREPKNLTYDWNTLSAKQRAIGHQRNYCLLLELTPEAASF